MERLLGIAAKPSSERAIAAYSKLQKWCVEHQIDYRIDHEFAAEHPELIADRAKVILRAEFTSQCPTIAVLGGDGTFISVARHASDRVPTILGVNLGTLGFLNELSEEELFTVLPEALAGRARAEKHFLLKARIEYSDGRVSCHTAFNDVVVAKEMLARIFGVELTIDEQNAALIRGDGLIISTPAGSTAYSLAAGGAIVHPGVAAMIVTPICPHSVAFRPIVVPASAKLGLKVASDASPERMQVYLTVDGQEGMPLRIGDRVSVETSTHAVNLVRSTAQHYFQKLSTKLKWAQH